MNKFMERLNAGEILVADGATGTNLQLMGVKAGTPPENLVMDDPDTILKLETAFVEAGADIILTCTFGGTRLRMKESVYADKAPEVNKRAAQLACQAASTRPDRTVPQAVSLRERSRGGQAQGGAGVLVAGSMGPTGGLFKPYGPLTTEEVAETYAEQAAALAEGGVDLLLIETMFAFDETYAAFAGARSVTDLPIVVSFSYDRGVRTMMGIKPTDVIKTYKEKGAALVGANCGTTLENMEKIIGEYAAAAPGFPLWAKPNAGLPRMDAETNVAVYDVTPEQMGEYARKYVALGARVVGGCCGSTPAHVAGIVKAVKGQSVTNE